MTKQQPTTSSQWLVKSETEVYSIDDLKRDKRTCWNLIRNYQARNFLREMREGDLVLFYHSNDPQAVGVAGVARVACTAYPDPSQFDKKGEYFDPKATKETPRWFSPDLAFVERFERVVSLDQIRAMKVFAGHQLVATGNRLSVMPLTAAQFQAVAKAGR